MNENIKKSIYIILSIATIFFQSCSDDDTMETIIDFPDVEKTFYYNLRANDVVGLVSATSNASEDINYTILSQTPNDIISVGRINGELTVTDDTYFQTDDKVSVVVQVLASVNNATESATVTITKETAGVCDPLIDSSPWNGVLNVVSNIDTNFERTFNIIGQANGCDIVLIGDIFDLGTGICDQAPVTTITLNSNNTVTVLTQSYTCLNFIPSFIEGNGLYNPDTNIMNLSLILLEQNAGELLPIGINNIRITANP
ncbi:hypothetical protein [Flavivirga rizhaonensis]|uniref:Cadherin repeat domain-containing protein n=1 Tax=Flavivirga rizhaonensis TaxID=2559571 RepID=A0A4S1DVI4_9FLAO|nr:hypothetical protein [Flavivirga rizhaonensis]TGV02120.1 hypothetical protein EM932_12180 [Flavivirga rizhaonensis]